MNDRLKRMMTTEVRGIPHEYLWAAFLLPVFLLGMAFFSLRIHPVGGNTILTCDLFHQYAPILAEFRRKILSGDSLFYTWNIGLGSDFWPILTYNCSSPLNLLLLFFPEKNLSDAIAILVLLRVGLSGLSFSLLFYGKERREGPMILLLSTLYALSGFVLSYFWAVMWMDAIVLLPLVVLGVWRLIEKKKVILFIVSLFLIISGNFYFGFFVCIFLAVFFFVLYSEARSKFRAQPFLPTFLRFAWCSVLSAAMAGIFLVPTILSLGQTAAATEKMTPTIENSFAFFDILSRFLLHADPVIREGLPNVACGVLLFLLIPLYFFCAGIPFRNRLLMGIMGFFLFVSMANPYLNFLWHGMHNTNQIPYRQAFLLVFLLLYMAAELFIHLENIRREAVIASVFFALSYLILLNFSSQTKLEPWLLYGSAAFMILYGIALTYLVKGSPNRSKPQKFLLYLVILEVFLSGEFALAFISENEHFTYYESYAQHADTISQDIDIIDQGRFTRTALLPEETGNDGAIFDLKSIPSFLSTTPQSTVRFLAGLGFGNNGLYEVWIEGLTEVSSRLLGVGNIVTYTDGVSVDEYLNLPATSDSDVSSDDVFAKRQDYMYGGYEITQNERVLPVGYCVPVDQLNYAMDPAMTPFENTNSLLSAMGVVGAYLPVERTEINRGNLSVGDSVDQFRIVSPDVSSTYGFRPIYYAPGGRLLLHVDTDMDYVVFVSAIDPETGKAEQSILYPIAGQIVDCGVLPENPEGIEVRIVVEKGATGQIRISTATVDADALDYSSGVLSDSSLEEIRYSSDSLSGTVNVPDGHLLLLTVPFDDGWTATVDGMPANTVRAYDALLAVELPAGRHEIHLSFVPRGLIAGVLLSIFAWIIFVVICLHKRIIALIPAKKSDPNLNQEERQNRASS